MTTEDRPDLLLLVPLRDEALERLRTIATVHDGTDAAALQKVLAAAASRVRAVLTIGTIGCGADLIGSLPSLETIVCMGVGYEGVDLRAAAARGIAVANGRGTNATAVADHALALILASLRGVVAGDRAVRRGEWRKAGSMRPEAWGRRVGILGLGEIGLGIARRCAGGFGMEVAYHNRRPRTDVPYFYSGSLLDLAARSDVLVLAAPGGADTRGMVDRPVLDALGPDGFLVNIARGSIVDNAALAVALREGRIAGAALDVVDGEPAVPLDLLDLDGLIFTPHIAGRSPQSQEAMLVTAMGNLSARFAGQSALHPVEPPLD